MDGKFLDGIVPVLLGLGIIIGLAIAGMVAVLLWLF